MNNGSITMSLMALIPALILCVYIYIKDRVEKEPIGLLSILFVAGAVGFIPAVIAEQFVINNFIDKMFEDSIFWSMGTAMYTSKGAFTAHSVMCAFLGTALIEETMKWLVLFLITHRNKNFNCLFDGVVYATFVSFGFAICENFRFALVDGWDTFVLRAVTSVPGHILFGIIMGYCYTMWHTRSVAAKMEKNLVACGKLSSRKIRFSPSLLVLSWIAPVLIHGIYTFTNIYKTKTMNIAFYVIVAVLYISSYFGINYLSNRDGEDSKVAVSWIRKKHPQADPMIFAEEMAKE